MTCFDNHQVPSNFIEIKEIYDKLWTKLKYVHPYCMQVLKLTLGVTSLRLDTLISFVKYADMYVIKFLCPLITICIVFLGGQVIMFLFNQSTLCKGSSFRNVGYASGIKASRVHWFFIIHICG